MNDLTAYLKVRQQIRPGDVIVFAGRKPISRLITIFGGSKLTHIGIVRQGAFGAVDVRLSESTIEHGKSGAQTNPLGETLAEYGDGAQAWWLPLSDDVRKLIDWVGFYQSIGAADGVVRYDVPGLLGFLARAVPIVGPHVFQSENQHAMVCSAFVTHVLEGSQILRGINYSKIKPQEDAEMRLYRDCVQLIGAAGHIDRFNTV